MEWTIIWYSKSMYNGKGSHKAMEWEISMHKNDMNFNIYIGEI